MPSVYEYKYGMIASREKDGTHFIDAPAGVLQVGDTVVRAIKQDNGQTIHELYKVESMREAEHYSKPLNTDLLRCYCSVTIADGEPPEVTPRRPYDPTPIDFTKRNINKDG